MQRSLLSPITIMCLVFSLSAKAQELTVAAADTTASLGATGNELHAPAGGNSEEAPAIEAPNKGSVRIRLHPTKGTIFHKQKNIWGYLGDDPIGVIMDTITR